MEYCLVEKWYSVDTLPPNCKAIALTPQASYQLKSRRESYLTFNEFFPSSTIWGDTDAYLRLQKKWVEEFDNFMQSISPDALKLNLKLPSLFFMNVKRLVDEVILASRVINEFISRADPAKIWFVPQIYGADKIERMSWFSFGESIYFRLTPLICQKRNISYEQLSTGSGEQVEESPVEHNQHLGYIALVKVEASNFLRVIKKFGKRWRCLLASFYFFSRKVEKKNILVIRELYYVYSFYKDCIRAGFNVFLKEKKEIYKFSWLLKKMKPNLFFDEEVVFTKDIDKVMDELMRSNIIEWVNKQCGVDVSDMLYSRFKFLLTDVFKKSIGCIKGYIDFYKRNHIDLVVTFSLSSVEDFSSVAAAHCLPSVKCVGFSHGIDAYESKARFLNENCLFDAYFVNSTEEMIHMDRLAEFFGAGKPVHAEYSYFRNAYYSFRKKRIKRRNKGDRPLVLFLPIPRFERFVMPIERSHSFQWDYFQWHYKLFDYFSTRGDYQFVWKSLLQPYGRGDSIADVIKNKNSENIAFSTSSVGEWFLKADRVICDIPSTAFFESIFCGLPVLALYRPDNEKLREEVYRNYGNSLQSYSNIPEGLKHIDNFLSNEPPKYIVPYNNIDISIPEVLMQQWYN